MQKTNPQALALKPKATPQGQNKTLFFQKNSSLYQEFVAERDEILRHKWIESEKAGQDIGFERALLDWILKHRMAWRANRARHYQQPSVA
jgi:hypothetical protein